MLMYSIPVVQGLIWKSWLLAHVFFQKVDAVKLPISSYWGLTDSKTSTATASCIQCVAPISYWLPAWEGPQEAWMTC